MSYNDIGVCVCGGGGGHQDKVKSTFSGEKMWAQHKHTVMATDRCMRVPWRADAAQAVTALRLGAWEVAVIEWATLCESLHELGVPNDWIA
jgi:hypothetical protein